MRNISFALTTEQFRARTKTVTRRLGWARAKAGDVLMACEKCQGIKAGQLVRLGPIRVVSARTEPLNAITADDVAREGFPGESPERFVARFRAHYGEHVIGPDAPVRRIEFEYLPWEGGCQAVPAGGSLPPEPVVPAAETRRVAVPRRKG